ncbi:MAG: DUF2304 domain-containing protein [Ruthenibacterium sp.]|mgnify:FL=1
MNVPNINLTLRLDMFLGAVVFLVVILWLLKKGRLTVRYSIIWLMAGGALLVFAVFPYIVLVLRDWLNIEMPVNVIFTLVLAFVLLLLLSLSTIVSGFAEKLKRLAQENALLEKRVRELEQALAQREDGPDEAE